MWFLKAIIHRAIRLIHASQFAICNLAPHICPGAPMFEAQQKNTRGSSRSTSPCAMSPAHQALRSTHQYVMDKIIMKFPKLLWVFQQQSAPFILFHKINMTN